MRITSVRIDSFGGLKDRRFDLRPGLNIFHGPNESGKTSLMEFIRTVLVPTSKRNVYPERSKSDSGHLDYTDGGEAGSIQLERNSRTGDIPSCISSLDPTLYRSIFAMDLDGLNDQGSVSSDEMRSRFLTVPGGERVPELMVGIDTDLAGLVGKTAASNCRINTNRSELEGLYSRIGELRSNAESYSELKVREEEMEAELRKASESSGSSQRNNELYAKVESQRPSYVRLEELKARRASLSSGRPVGQEERDTYRRLTDDVTEKRSSYNAVNGSRKELLSTFPGADDSAARARRSEIQDVLEHRGEYNSRLAVPKDASVAGSKLRIPVAIVLAVAAVLSFILVPADIMIRAVLAAVFGIAAVAVFLLMRGKVGKADISNASWIQSYESRVRAVSSGCGVVDMSVPRQLDVLASYDRSLTGLDALKGNLNDLRMEQMSAENRLLTFLSRYGGEEGYQKALRDSEELARVDAAIDSVRRSIRDSGFDPDRPLPSVERVEIDTSRESDLGRELGALRERMRSVLDTEELDSLIDRCYMLRKDRESILRAGAVAMLSSQMVRDACEGQFTQVRPGVVQTADKYLGMMTGGIYHLDTDPRSKEIAVIAEGNRKGPKQWSSGLRAQVMLAIKLAVAKEMGSGEIPMMLDDVLLPFDQERMEGASEALSQVSKEMQILLFTCDDRVVGMCERLSDVNIVSMKTD